MLYLALFAAGLRIAAGTREPFGRLLAVGVVTWATAANQATGPNTFTVMVSDNSVPALTASATFTVDVNTVEAPIVEPIPTQGVNIGQTLTVNLASYVFDFNSPSLPLTYALSSGAPVGASLNPTTGVLTLGSRRPLPVKELGKPRVNFVSLYRLYR